jgi:hypothetical protein
VRAARPHSGRPPPSGRLIYTASCTRQDEAHQTRIGSAAIAPERSRWSRYASASNTR